MEVVQVHEGLEVIGVPPALTDEQRFVQQEGIPASLQVRGPADSSQPFPSSSGLLPIQWWILTLTWTNSAHSRVLANFTHIHTHDPSWHSPVQLRSHPPRLSSTDNGDSTKLPICQSGPTSILTWAAL